MHYSSNHFKRDNSALDVRDVGMVYDARQTWTGCQPDDHFANWLDIVAGPYGGTAITVQINTFRE